MSGSAAWDPGDHAATSLRVVDLLSLIAAVGRGPAALPRLLGRAARLVGADRAVVAVAAGPDAPLEVRWARTGDGRRLGRRAVDLPQDRLLPAGSVQVDAGAVRAPLDLPAPRRGVLVLDGRAAGAAAGPRERELAGLVAGLVGLLVGLRLLARDAAGLRRRIAAGEPDPGPAGRPCDPPAPGPAPPRRDGFPELVGRSRALRDLVAALERLRTERAPVLIQGESGTGKELVARALHRGGPRARAGFVAVNCAAFPEHLLEKELFGARRGAFTGATDDADGVFALAHGGTLLLDEVGDMPLAMQAKLLRVLETGEVRPLGAPRGRRVDVRVLAATHRDLRARVAEGLFRADLFYRLAVVVVRVPPLRERAEDVPLLAARFLAERGDDPPRRLSEGARELLRRRAWPGNVRELKNALERACAFGGRVLTVSDFGFLAGELEPPGPAPDPRAPVLPLDEVARREVRRALARSGGNVRAAARLLGVHPSTLYRRLKRRAGPARTR